MLKATSFFLVVILLHLAPSQCRAFGVITHEAIIHAAWDHSLVPLLKKSYPGTTAEVFCKRQCSGGSQRLQ